MAAEGGSALLWVAAAGVLLGGGCGGPTRMGGFPEHEARASMTAEAVDGCAVRTGRLIIETETILVREYPHYGAAPGRRLEEPMLVTLLAAPGAGGAGGGAAPPKDDARGGELAIHGAPAAFEPGRRVVTLERLRLLDRPLGALVGRRFTVRLAENDRTKAPRWAEVGTTATKTTAAASVVGLPSPAGALAEALEILRQLDRDDLILLADVELDRVAAQLALPAGDAPTRQRAARLRFATARRVALGPGAGQPSAEMTLLAYREAETGCP
ncbi:MAG TPA: hypothetical protein VIU64_13445 [Polyangia bacterium]